MKKTNQPSDEALKNMLRFLLKTSVPRMLAREAQNENNQQAVASNDK
ncbi:hypothetical protein ACMGD3_23740 [Lysinibacillus sphaericus]